jgi:hypothetical protein
LFACFIIETGPISHRVTLNHPVSGIKTSTFRPACRQAFDFSDYFRLPTPDLPAGLSAGGGQAGFHILIKHLKNAVDSGLILIFRLFLRVKQTKPLTRRVSDPYAYLSARA